MKKYDIETGMNAIIVGQISDMLLDIFHRTEDHDSVTKDDAFNFMNTLDYYALCRKTNAISKKEFRKFFDDYYCEFVDKILPLLDDKEKERHPMVFELYDKLKRKG